MLAADGAFGWLFLMAHNGDMGGTSSSLDRFRPVLLGMIGLPGPMHFTEATTSSLVASVLAALGAITGSVASPAPQVIRSAT